MSGTPATGTGPTRHDAFARALHWSMAALILAMLFVGVAMVASVTLRPSLLALHRPIGIALLLLAVLRLLHRVRRRVPPLPADLPRWQRLAAQVSHVALYALMLAMPLVGWAMVSAAGNPVTLWGGLVLPPIAPPDPLVYSLLRASHAWLARALFALVLLHLAAALMHAWVRRDGVFRSMAPGRGSSPT
ncbi:cytochrome b [Luteimonas deserti]|uniref:Cytochrome b/b6 domain-containing protein n=1 Tax=Luteimonas deserti TaxID=2752306 RepID=A0A7Z0TTK2_9GAMM|nr:cytochrome b/b6 domain-containing protein [Luteimonas deserti]NYZ61881.1 cytochrome b/b6 domain-containing protein [Luteimonas deserti]